MTLVQSICNIWLWSITQNFYAQKYLYFLKRQISNYLQVWLVHRFHRVNFWPHIDTTQNLLAQHFEFSISCICCSQCLSTMFRIYHRILPHLPMKKIQYSKLIIFTFIQSINKACKMSEFFLFQVIFGWQAIFPIFPREFTFSSKNCGNENEQSIPIYHW